MAKEGPRAWEADAEIEAEIARWRKEGGEEFVRPPDCAEHDGHHHTIAPMKLYLLRKERGLSREELADLGTAGPICCYAHEWDHDGSGRTRSVTVGDIRRFERGTAEPAFTIAGSIASALDVPLAGLVYCHGPRRTRAQTEARERESERYREAERAAFARK